MIKERVSVQVSLVIAAIDDFSSRPVSRSQLHVWIDGEQTPVAKEGGYFVFTNLRTTHPLIHLEGPMFHRQEIALEEQTWMQYQGKVLKVRMIPNRSYPVPHNTTCVQGHAVPGSTILAYNKSLKQPFKLLYPYTAGQKEISIFHPDDVDLEGKIFRIQNKECTKQEILRIAEPTEADGKKMYRLHEPLTHTYKKIGTAVYPVYVSQADQTGEFFLPASGIYTETAVFVFWREGNGLGKDKKEMELQNGKVNLLSGTL